MSVVNTDDLRDEVAEQQEEFLSQEEAKEMDAPPEEARSKAVKGYIDQNTDNIVVAELSDVKFPVTNKMWSHQAKAIYDKFRDYLNCNPATILFVEIKDSKAKYKGQPKFFEAAVISKMWQQILKQLTGKNFTHIIKIHAGNIEKFDQTFEMCLVHLYEEMRKIKADGSLGDYAIRAFPEVQQALRNDWAKEGSVIPNLIDAGNWAAMHNLQGKLFGESRQGENELAKSGM